MAIEPVKIPQNVYVEDRIIGPITLRQLIIIGVGAGISYALYASVAKQVAMSVPLGLILWSPAMIAVAFAFLKINDLDLFTIILLSVEHMSKPTTRVWCPHPGISINIVTKPQKQEILAPVTATIASNVRLDEIMRQLERQQRQIEILTGAEPTVADGQVQTPKAEPVSAPAPSTEMNQSAAIQAVKSTNAAQTVPVNKDRVSVSGLDASRSVDGVNSNGLTAFRHIFNS